MWKNPKIKDVVYQDPYLAPRIETGRTATITSSLDQCEKTGRLEAFKLLWKPEMGPEKQPHQFWDSDVAKVLEGVAYYLGKHPDAELEARYDQIVKDIISAQQPDGYINTYFTLVAPEKRWSNLHEMHELYCAGHLLEAAIAAKTELGRDDFLEAMIRYVDYIDQVFGPGENQIHGYPGHEELELALFRLYELTGVEKYRDLGVYFITERGKKPNYFVEKENCPPDVLLSVQGNCTVKERTQAEGHAVRVGYLYTGAALAALHSKDPELEEACERIFDNISQQKMYVSGGIGSTFVFEAFTKPYDLPNGAMMYTESCASISLVYFCNAMLRLNPKSKYADVMERVLFNGALAGISLSGDRYFYTNYMEKHPAMSYFSNGAPIRQLWFGCSCCPTNYCRFLPESVQYAWTYNDDCAMLHLPLAQTAKLPMGKFEVSGNYPYDGNIQVKVLTPGKYTLAIRIPGWCRKAEFKLNGEKVTPEICDNYARFEAVWTGKEVINFELDMPVEVLRTNLKVIGNQNKVALQRGPLVYALEGVDNFNSATADLYLNSDGPFTVLPAEGLPEGTLAIRCPGWKILPPEGLEDVLYHTGKNRFEPTVLTAIPYALWQNRADGDMSVWINERQ